MKRLLFLCLLVAGCRPESTIPSTSSEIERDIHYCRERVMMITNSGHRFVIVHASIGDAVSICEVTEASLIDGGLGRIVTNALHATGLDTRPYAEDYWKR